MRNSILIQSGFKLLLNKVSLRRMPQILKGIFSSKLEKIWAQIRQGAFDHIRGEKIEEKFHPITSSFTSIDCMYP